MPDKETEMRHKVLLEITKLPEFEKEVFCTELSLEQIIGSYMTSFPEEEQQKLKEMGHEIVHLCFFRAKNGQYGIAIFSHDDPPRLLYKKTE